MRQHNLYNIKPKICMSLYLEGATRLNYSISSRSIGQNWLREKRIKAITKLLNDCNDNE